ncbi:MAG: TonB-dependent receptor [Cyclobacteriaceae bacterium]
MAKRSVLGIIVWGAIFMHTYGQTEIRVIGKLFDIETQQPIPYASIVFTNQSGDLINGGISGEDGQFIIEGITPGSFQLTITSVGYEESTREIHIGQLNQNYDLGRISIIASAEELEEVVVTGAREEIAAGLDRKTYSMQQNIAQSGGSVMDAMKAMPGVSFDQDGKVILRGSDRVIVLIDGKQSSLTGYGNQKGLDNLPAANIERIEIINNPSAKYDANGMAGIINIVYKKERQSGLHGSVGFAYGLGVLSKRKPDLPTDLGSYSPTPKYIPSLDLNLKQDKFNFFLQSEVLFQERLPNNEFTTRYYDDGTTISSQVPENRSQTHYIIKGGFDYLFDGMNTLTISGIYDWESHVDTAQVAYIDQDNIRNRYITWNEEEITGYLNYALRFEHKFNQYGHHLQANLQYSKGWEDETYFVNDSSAIRSNGRDVTTVLGTEHITSAGLDYVKPTASGRLESGAKVQIRNLPVAYEQQRDQNSMLYDGLGNFSRWGERLYAAYANWVHEKKEYDVEGGLRAEYTDVFYNIDPANTYYEENDSYNYFRLFPNVRFTYKLNENNRMSAFYNQRIDRPGEPELRIYTKSDDHELVKVGNPYLRPQFTQSAELAFQHYWENGSIFISGYWRFIDDAFQRVYTEDTTSIYNVVVKSYANTGSMNHSGLELIVSQEFSEVWKVSGNLNLYNIRINEFTGQLLFPYKHSFEINEDSDLTWDLKVVNTFKVSNQLQLQLTGLYAADKSIPQGRQLSRSSVDFGAQQKLFKGKGELTISMSDIFNRYGLRQEIDGIGFVADYQNFYETQSLRVAFKYRF